MNTLKYSNLADAASAIKEGRTLEDGTVVTAPAGAVEGHKPWADVLTVEDHARDKDGNKPEWRKEWSDGIYHYELLIARNGIKDNGDAGIEVIGTNRKAW